jgi:peptidoglycan/LPS O-acetylase OafA/YrhL
MFLVVMVSSSARTGLGRIMRTGLMKRFGRYCYSIYLTHFLLLNLGTGAMAWIIVHTGAANHSLEVRLLVALPIVAAVSLALAFVTFNLIERPCIRLGKRLVARLNAVAATEPLQPAPASLG